MESLTWAQVNAFRLSQHALSPRLPSEGLVEAVARTGGVQAQLMSAAEQAVGVRVDGITRDDVQTALWRERSLVKTWAMRGTLHLLPAADLPLYVAARTMHDDRDWAKYFAYFGFTPAQQEAYLAAVPEVLSAQPLTREEFATAVAEHIGAPELGALLRASSWGSLFKPSALPGDLCFGPNRGQNVTFVHPGKWTGEWQAVEPEPALQEIARRYLRSYGPANPEDFARWWDGGNRIIEARRLFRSIRDELEEVSIEGRGALALRETLSLLRSAGPARSVNLLPLFDAYVLGGGRDIEELLPAAHKLRVFRPQGWITAVVLVDGAMKGIWEYKNGRSRAIVVRMFSPASLTPATRRGIEAEAERLGAFLKSPLSVEYAEL